MTKKEGLLPTAPEQQSPLNAILSQREKLQASKLNVPDVELAGCMVKRAINVFVAQSGSGKSLLAFCLAWNETRSGNFKYTFYFDLDNPANVFKDRYANFPFLQNFFYISELDLATIFESFPGGTTPREKSLAILENLSIDASIENCLIVLDSLQSFCDYNDLKELKKFFDICRKLARMGATVLILHHKSSKQESPSFKGLSYIKDSADIMWEVVPNRTKAGIVSSITLTCSKNRSVISFTSFTVSFSTDTGTVSYDQNVLLEEEIPVKEAILKILNTQGKMKQSDLVQAVKPFSGIGEKRIRAVLEKLVGLHILNVSTGKKNAKLYSINPDAVEPGYFDAMDEQDATLDALPF